MLGRLLTISAACGLLFIGVTPLAAQPDECDPEPAMAMIWQEGTDARSIYYPVLSADGRYVAFTVNHNHSPTAPSYVVRYDRLLCRIEIVTADENGNPSPRFQHIIHTAISASGQYIVLDASSWPFDNDRSGIFLSDMHTHEIVRISVSDYGLLPTISADGRYIVYGIYPNNSEPTGVFMYDRFLEDTVELVSSSTTNDASYFPTISADGQFIAFFSNMMYDPLYHDWGDIFLYEVATGDLDRIFLNLPPQIPVLSADGRFMVFHSGSSELVPDDRNEVQDVFVYDRLTGDVERVSVASDGTEGNRSSGDDRSSISADGRYVVFSSAADNFATGDIHLPIQYDVFIHDRETRQTKRVSVDRDGRQVNYAAAYASISADSRFITFLTNHILPQELPSYDSWLEVHLTDWQAIPNLPSEVAPQRNVFPTATPTLRWSAITWAAAYEIQIDDTDDFSSPVYHSATLTAAEVITPDLPNGVYYWRVRAQRPNGTWSEWSVVDSFVVDVP